MAKNSPRRLRHPRSQGLVERGNATLCDILGKFLHDRGTDHWIQCLGAVMYSMNTSLARGVDTVPFEIVFGQKPRVDLAFICYNSHLSTSNKTDDLIKQPHFDESSRANLGSQNSQHMSIRDRAAEVYLANANKRITAHNRCVQHLSENCAVGDFIGVKIDKVDRTSTDPKPLPCVIIHKKHHAVKVACVNGIIDQWWPLESLVRLTAVPQ
ncbi:unnamed protein product, partial [Didymodactylos carnosus]